MYLKKVELLNIRNYINLSLELVPGINVFYGKNGSGKTNIIEAVYWTAMLKSFRTSEDFIIVKNGMENAKIEIEAVAGGLEKNYSLEYNAKTKRKSLKENGSRLAKISDIIGRIPVVIFSPENIMMIKGEPGLRRKFVDDMISQINPGYYRLLLKYTKEVSHRNYLLKGIRENRVNKFALNVWNKQIMENGCAILLARIDAVKKLNNILHENFFREDIKIEIEYFSKKFNSFEAGSIMETYEKHFEEKTDEEIARATTLIGPHRDDLIFKFNEMNAKQFASEGQQRLAAILIKLAEGLHIKNSKGTYPVVMLDDFSSELDNPNRGFIGETFSQFKQIIITTVYPENLKGFKPDREYTVDKGSVSLV